MPKQTANDPEYGEKVQFRGRIYQITDRAAAADLERWLKQAIAFSAAKLLPDAEQIDLWG